MIHTKKYETNKLDIKNLNSDLTNLDYKMPTDNKLF